MTDSMSLLLSPTPLLDFAHPLIERLIAASDRNRART